MSVPRPTSELVRSIVPRPPPVPVIFVSIDPSPINIVALIEEAVTCCDDTKEANKDPVLIFRDEILLKLLR